MIDPTTTDDDIDDEHEVPRTDRQAVHFLMKVTADEARTVPAAELFRVRRARGDGLLEAYETALRAMLKGG